MGSAKRERHRAKKAKAERAEWGLDEPAISTAGIDPPGGTAARRKPPPKVEVKQGDWWRLYGMTTPMPWLEPDEPDGGT